MINFNNFYQNKQQKRSRHDALGLAYPEVFLIYPESQPDKDAVLLNNITYQPFFNVDLLISCLLVIVNSIINIYLYFNKELHVLNLH